MRKYLVFLFVAFCIPASWGQDIFTVIKVSGNIVIERTGTPLGTGTSFAQNENLLFKVPDSRAAVINPKRGRFILTSQNFADFRSSKSNYLPSASKITMRAISPGNAADAMKARFEGTVVLLDKNKFIIDTTEYPMTARNYFYLTYNFNNRIINKTLNFSKDTLLIDKKVLLTVNGKIIPGSGISQIDLIYIRQGETKSLSRISTFKPVFPENRNLSKEIAIILDQMEMNPYSDKIREVSAYITEFYGKIDETTLKTWLAVEHNLKP